MMSLPSRFLIPLCFAALGLLGGIPPTPGEAQDQPEPSFAQRCQLEVEQLHAFFEAWFNGTVENTDESYARFSGVLADGFVTIGPAGNLKTMEQVVESLRQSYKPAAAAPIRIWIEDFQLRQQEGPVAVVTYQEWQEQSGQRRGRLSTAVLREHPGHPNGVEWLHVHETWLPRR